MIDFFNRHFGTILTPKNSMIDNQNFYVYLQERSCTKINQTDLSCTTVNETKYFFVKANNCKHKKLQLINWQTKIYQKFMNNANPIWVCRSTFVSSQKSKNNNNTMWKKNAKPNMINSIHISCSTFIYNISSSYIMENKCLKY